MNMHKVHHPDLKILLETTQASIPTPRVPLPDFHNRLRRFPEKVIPNWAWYPPFEKGGSGGISTDCVNPQGSNPPSPPFAKGGNGASFLGQAGQFVSGNHLSFQPLQGFCWFIKSNSFTQPL
jgi:hypothetical protein